MLQLLRRTAGRLLLVAPATLVLTLTPPARAQTFTATTVSSGESFLLAAAKDGHVYDIDRSAVRADASPPSPAR